jgi:ribosomal protein L40E
MIVSNDFLLVFCNFSFYLELTSKINLFSRHHDSSIRTTTISHSGESISLDQRSCIDILNENIQILDMFINRLTTICSEWREAPISNILHLFPDIQYVDHDFEILKPLLPSNDIKPLKRILDYWKDRDYIYHTCHGLINLLHNLDKSSDPICNSVKNIPGMNSQADGTHCYARYQRYSSIFLQNHSKELLNFICQYSLSNELITFLNRLHSTDVDNLLQAVNDWDETLINTKTILDFVMLKRFFVRFNQEIDSTKNEPFSSTLVQIETAFEKTFEDEQFKNIFNCFQTCSASLTTIKRIHLELTDKELSKRNRISDLMKNITFHFTKQSNKFNIDIQPQSMSVNDLCELRDRARLIEYSINNNKFSIDSERDIKELHSFVTFVEIVEKILKNFTLLDIAGHPSIINYLSPNKSFTCINSDYQELIKFSLMLDNLHYDWEIHLCHMYEKHIDLTYFSYQQIWIIEDYLYNHIKSFDQNHFGYHLLKYIGIQPETIQSEYLPIESQNPNERLENIGKILTAQRIKSNLTFKQENRNIKKVYLVETSDEGILRSILSLFKNLHITISVNHLFYCTEETTWMEIRAFTYRCFYSQTLHQLIRPELLSASIHDHFTRLLKQLIDQYPQHYFRLGIITTVSNTHLQLINGLRTLQIVHTIHDQEMLNKTDLQEIIKKFIDENSVLVTSRINGLGKSYLIKNEIKKKNKSYIKFPISGDIDVDTIAERLCHYGNELISAALHIDIGAINNLKQLNEILYCLLLFRSFRFGQVAVSIPIDVPIYIELDSSPYSINLHDKIVLFKYMNLKHIDHIDWNEFEITNPSVIQLVANYLQAIKDQTILKKNLNENNLINFDKLTCINLIKEPFLQNKNLEFVTWTQLSIFISVYYSLFSGFSRCGFFLIETVPNPQLRYDILQSLLQSSNQFTSLCIEDVRKNQRSVNTNEAIIPFSESIVRWDKTQPFTVVFSATDNPIFVYKKPTNVPSSLVQAFQLHYEAITGKKDYPLNEIFPDYSKFDHTQFFQKLALLSKKYFNKSICVKCFSQYKYDQIQCTKCETNGILYLPISWKSEDIDIFQQRIAEIVRLEYVLTPDNYIKMLLIYLRVQSGLPVLIMGETGN